MEYSLKVIDIGTNGDGIARLEDGATVFVPFSAPGDIVMADVFKEQDGQYRAKINSILLKSPLRTTPPCRHFGICGGCSLQHLNEKAYRDFKVKSVTDALAKSGIVSSENLEIVFVPQGTRRRANFAARVTKGKAIIGFHEKKSASIRDVPDCLLITEEVRSVMEGIRPYISDIAGEGGKIDILIQCVSGMREVALTGKIAPGWEAQQALSDALRTLDLARISLRARDYEEYKIILEAKPYYVGFDSLFLNLAPGAFLQPSSEGQDALTDCVVDGAADASCVADLFCGNGTFTGPLLKAGRDVMAADFAPDAIEALKKAGVNAQLRNLFKSPLAPDELSGVECVVLDPPRAGAKEQVSVLSESRIPRIVYVSCNPQTFARDAAVLIERGYKLEKLTIIDQFVWSPHTEIAAIFDRT